MRASEQAKRAGQGREEAAGSMGLAADLAPVEILAVDLQTPTLRSYIATYVRLMAEFYRHVAASPPHQLRCWCEASSQVKMYAVFNLSKIEYQDIAEQQALRLLHEGGPGIIMQRSQPHCLGIPSCRSM